MTQNQTALNLQTLFAQHQTLIGQTGLLNVTGNTGGAPLTTTLEIKRPWIDPPQGHVPYDLQSGIALPAVGAGDTVVLTLTVDNSYDGVINWISHNFTGGGFTDFSGNLVWRIEDNGKPIRNFQAMTAQKGTIGIPRPVSPIRIYSGHIITYVVNHVANGTLNGNIICSLGGYFYPNRGT